MLHALDLDIPKGDFLALMGPSGSGKSTLLNLIGGLDRPTAGTIEIAGQRTDAMSEGELGRWRANHVGFVFQMYNLLPVLSAERNVELPLLLTSLSASERRKRTGAALSLVGLSDRAKHKPRELSGGQEQRVGIARAIVSDPTLLLCDEPTGDLDRKSGDEILDLLQALNQQQGKTIIMVTHDPHAAARAKHMLHLNKGQLDPRSGRLRRAMFKYLPLLWANLRRKRLRTRLTLASIVDRVPAVRPAADAARRAHRRRRSRRRGPADHDAQGVAHPVVAAQLSEPHPRRRRRRGRDRAELVRRHLPGRSQPDRRDARSMPTTFFEVYPEYQLPPEQKRGLACAIAPARSSAKSLAERFGWKVGDTIPLRSNIFTQKDGGNVWADEDRRHLRRHERRQPEHLFPLRLLQRVAQLRQGPRSAGSSSRIDDPDDAAEIARNDRRAVRELLDRDQDQRPRRRSCRASPTRWATSARSSRRSPPRCSSRCCW